MDPCSLISVLIHFMYQTQEIKLKQMIGMIIADGGVEELHSGFHSHDSGIRD